MAMQDKSRQEDKKKHKGRARQGPAQAQAKTLRVLQVLPALEMGGVETGAVALGIYLQNEGHTSVVCSRGGALVDKLEAAGVKHITLPVQSKNPWVILRNSWRLRQICQENQIQVIHARSRAPAISCFIAAKLARIPFVTTFHGTYNFQTWIKKLYNAIMVQGDRVIAISEFIRDHIETHYKNWVRGPVTVIPRGIDLSRFAREQVTPEAQQELRQFWGLSHQVPLIICPGRLTRWKGQRTVIQAVSLLHQRHKPCYLVLIGSAQGRLSYLRELQALTRHHSLTPWVIIDETNPPMATAYRIADVVVHASTDPEAFGRVIVEAQAMGVPVIASNKGAPPEIIEPGQTGFLHEAGNAADLAAALEKALALSPEDKKALCARAAEKVKHEYNETLMFERTVQVYREVLCAH